MHGEQYKSTTLRDTQREILLQAKQDKGDCFDRVNLNEMVLGTVRWEAAPRKRRPKALGTKLSQGGPS
jgi:hypothetical protein